MLLALYCMLTKRQLVASPRCAPRFTGKSTDQHTPQNTRAHGVAATPTLCHPYGPFLQPTQSYKPHSLLDRVCKDDGPKKDPKARKHRVAVFGQARVRTRGGGGVTVQIARKGPAGARTSQVVRTPPEHSRARSPESFGGPPRWTRPKWSSQSPSASRPPGWRPRCSPP